MDAPVMYGKVEKSIQNAFVFGSKTTTVTAYATVEGIRDDVWEQKLEDHYDCYRKILDIIRPTRSAQPHLVKVEWQKDN